MAAQHTVFFCAQALDGVLGALVQIVGTPADHIGLERFERIKKHQVFADRIDMGALPRLGIPGVADFQAGNLGHNVVISRGADNFAGLGIEHHKRQHVSFLLTLERGFYIRGFLAGFRHRCEGQVP